MRGFFRQLYKNILSLLLLGTLLSLIYIFFMMKPTNQRDWEAGQEILPKIEVTDTTVKISDVRDFKFEENKIISSGYTQRSVNIENIEKVWFLVEPFGGFDGIAHTYFVFDFKDSEPIAVSVEARREKGEKYYALLGAFNQYELIYIFGSESDETIRRVIYENNKLYMYPLNISKLSSQALFLELSKNAKGLEEKPRFYNTLTSNCTNELSKSANVIKPGSIPFNVALFLPGYSVKELYKLGYLPTDLPVEKLPERYFISDFVRENYKDADFSKKLREFLK